MRRQTSSKTRIAKRKRKTAGRQTPKAAQHEAKKRPSRHSGKRSPRSGKSAFALGMVPGLDLFVGKFRALGAAARTLADRVTLTVAPKTISGEPIQHQRGRLRERDIEHFRPSPKAADGAVERLQHLGFQILRRGRFGITVSAPAALVSEILKTDLLVHARPHRTTVRATQNFAFSYLPPRSDDLYVAPAESPASSRQSVIISIISYSRRRPTCLRQ